MTIEALIEKAIAGGWESPSMNWYATTPGEREQLRQARINQALLSPAFWRAVGKELDWGSIAASGTSDMEIRTIMPQWKFNMHRFLDALIEADANGIPQEEAVRMFINTL